MFLKETFFTNITDNDIRNIAIEHFGLYAPSVSKRATERGCEYYHIEGVKFGEDGSLEPIVLNLSYYGPSIIRQDGQIVVDLDQVYSNLTACKGYICFMDERNFGISHGGSSYTTKVRSLYELINRRLNKLDSSEREFN